MESCQHNPSCQHIPRKISLPKLFQINYSQKRLQVGKQNRTLAFFQPGMIKADLRINKKKEKRYSKAKTY